METSQKKHLLLFTLACAGHFCVDFMISLWPIFKVWSALNITIAGLIGGGSAFLAEILQPIFGKHGDKYGRIPLVLLGILCAAFMAFLPLFESPLIFFLLVLACFIGSSLFHPAAASLCGTLSQENKGRRLGVFAFSGALGMATGQSIFSCCIDHSKWTSLLLIIPPLIVAALCWWYQHHEPKIVNKENHQEVSLFQGIATLFRRSDIRLLYFGMVTSSALFWGFVFLLPDALMQRGDASWLVWGGGHFGLIIGGALMMVPAGMLADRIGATTVLIGAIASSLVLMILFLTTAPINPWLTLFLLLFIGASIGVNTPLSLALGHKLAPESPGLISALLMGLVWCVSETVGVAGSGLATHLFETTPALSALTLLVTLNFASLICFLRLNYIQRTAPFSNKAVESSGFSHDNTHTG